MKARSKNLLIELASPFPPSKAFNPNVRFQCDLSHHLGVIGTNASGKRSILFGIAKACANSGLQVETVNFETHRHTVRSEGNDTVSRILGGMRDNADIVVRFGLTNVWWRKMKSLSTGELRKVLLARAVSKNPDVLILDRPFDGLDFKSRKSLITLLEEVSNTSQQTQARPLVQGIKWQERSPVRIVVATHRPLQELPSRIHTILKCENDTFTIRPRTQQDLVEMEKQFMSELTSDNHEKKRRLVHAKIESEAAPLPAEPLLDVQRLTVFPVKSETDNILDGKNLSRPLLDRVSWCVHPREVWWLQGENGASKSVLLSCAVGPQRLLQLAHTQHATREWALEHDPDADRRRKRPPAITCTESVEMVSTELHMALLESASSSAVLDMLLEKCSDEHRIRDVLTDLGLPLDRLQRSFKELSVGEQKLVLICGAVAAEPKLLILDEPCQSLDLAHRRRVALVVDKLCTSTTADTACIFVTHHEDELPRVVSHRLVMQQGRVASRGQYHVTPLNTAAPAAGHYHSHK